MRRQRGLVRLMGLAALVGLWVAAKPAGATSVTEQSASILMFPKVIANGSRDTVIQITNTSNNMRHAHCFYVNAALTIPNDPNVPEGPSNPPLWTETDFDIWLTKQQPTHWVVSRGRRDPAEESQSCRQTVCDPDTSGTTVANCCDSGLDPGFVPPVAPDFVGELKCIETDASGAPVGGNALKGEATLVQLDGTSDVSKYNAIGLKGFDTNDRNNVLCVGGGVSDLCPFGAEYAACPDTWILDHPVIDSHDAVVENAPCPADSTCSSTVSANLTVIPCTEDFENQAPPAIVLQFVVTNEFEQSFSASTTFQCWKSIDLNDISGGIIFTEGTLGGTVARTRMKSLLAATNTSTAFPPGTGVLPVIEETHTATVTDNTKATSVTLVTRSAQNAHSTFTDKTATDFIVIPEGQGGDQ